MTIKQMDCYDCFPGNINYISRDYLDILMRRDGKHMFFYDGIHLGGDGDNQRRTEFYYIYAGANLLGGK